MQVAVQDKVVVVELDGQVPVVEPRKMVVVVEAGWVEPVVVQKDRVAVTV